MEKITFTLNEGLIFKAVFDATLTNFSVKRSVRPFIKVISSALKEAKAEYDKIRKEIFESEKTEQEKMSEFANKIADYNNKVILNFDFTRNSTKNFFYSFWNRFEFDPKLFGENISEITEEIDEKICSIYPELNVDLDKPEEEKA